MAPWAFRNEASTARMLHEFARAERGSMLDMQLAAAHTDDAQRAALYLRHAADEARHARVFNTRADTLAMSSGAEISGHARATTPGLYELLGERDFVAYVHRGEARARKQFDSYVAFFRAKGRATEKRIFEGILVDERRHEAYTGELLAQYSATERRQALRRAARRDGWERFRRMGRAPASVIYRVGMVLIYLSFFPLGVVLRWQAARRTGGWRHTE